MEQTTAAPAQTSDLPPLRRDLSLYGLVATQFLGAFNDNVFKQLVLLICVDYSRSRAASGDVYQTMAQALFAIPFVLFSGYAGFLSDRTSKRTIVVLAKVAEIAVMAAGLTVFLLWDFSTTALLYGLFAVLFFMGAQSAFFGPSKYGILPEMFREGDLPAINGVVQMTTFLAIIFGTVTAGYAKEAWGPPAVAYRQTESLPKAAQRAPKAEIERQGALPASRGPSSNGLWLVSGLCIAIAVAGTATALVLRRTGIAHPGLQFSLSLLVIGKETRDMLRSDRPLLSVLLISSLFWFIGGCVLPAVNVLGKLQLNLGDDRTSRMAASLGLGISLGCLLAGPLSRHRVNFRLVNIGAWGIAGTLCGTSVLAVSNASAEVIYWGSLGLLTSLGVFGGLFAVPLQVFMQARPPKDQKGRMIGAMNLLNWIGILLSSAYYFACTVILKASSLPPSWTFAAAGVFMLPVALLFRAPSEKSKISP